MDVPVFGGVAVVPAASETWETGTDVSPDGGGYPSAKEGAAWRIAAHAWHKATEEVRHPIVLAKFGLMAFRQSCGCERPILAHRRPPPQFAG